MPESTCSRNGSNSMPALHIQDLLNSAPIGVFTTTPEGRIIWANAVLVRMFGYESPEQLIASITDIAAQLYADPADRDEFMRLLEEHGEVLDHACRFRRRDGTEFWGAMNVRAIRDEKGRIAAYRGFITDITEQKKANEKLKRLEWMLSGEPISNIEVQAETQDQGYGDLTQLNRDGIILRSIGRERLESFANDHLELLGTSSAIYEVNGDYAFGIFSSGWCRMMDSASRRLCDTSDNAEALNSGRWLCHESCWTDCSKQAIAECAPVDIECNGGLRIYAVPVFAGKDVVGAINFGYGDPPEDPEQLRKLSETYHLDYEDLVREANAYDSRPPFVIELAKKRLHSTARLIGAMVETKQVEEALRETERGFRGMLGVVPDMISIHSPDMDILYSNWQGFGAVPETMRKTDTKCYRTYRGHNDICPDCLARTVLETGKPLREEARLPDGTWVDLRVIPLLDENNNVEMFMEWVRDITDRKQDEEMLRESKEMLRATLNSIGDAVIATDMDGLVVAMNPVAESLTGWSEKDATGQPLEAVFRIVNEKTRQPVESPVTNVLKSGRIVGLANHTLLLAKDGREIPIADSGAPIRNEAGETTGVVLVFRDQTEERAAREALESNYALLRIAGETARFGGWSVDLKRNICTWSDAVADIHDVPHGYAPPVQEGINFYAPEWQEKITEVFSACAEKGIPYDEEMEIITQKGRRVWVRTIGKAVKDEKGSVVNVLGSFQDITERKRHEEHIEHLLHALRAIRDVNQLINHENDRDELLRQSCEILISTRGYRSAWVALRDADGNLESVAESGIGDDFAVVRQAMQQGEWPECHRRALEQADGIVPIHNTESNCKTCPLSHTYRDTAAMAGALRHGARDYGVLVVALPAGLADDPEEQSLFRELVRDIAFALYTIESREVLAEKEVRFQELADSLPQVVFEIDIDGRFTYVNTRSFEMFGYTQQALAAGLNAFQMLIPEDRERLSMNIARVMAGEELGGTEYTALRRDQSPFPVVIYSTRVIRDGRPVGSRGLVVDVTNQKHAEETRRKLELQLLEAQKMESVGRLAGGVAHDFNNMLGVILGNAELALAGIPPDDPLHEDLEQILDAARRSTDITRQLLAFARRQTIDPKEIDLNETVEYILKMLRRIIGEDIDLSWQPGPGRMPVFMDPSQLDQLLANLCVNARDAIDGVGKLTIETDNITFDRAYCDDHAGFVPGDFVLLAVSDDGHGMDKDTLDNVFEPFFTTKEVGKGTGLGLSTVYGIVKQNDGFINVYSEPGKGTTFRIYLPRHEGEAGLIEAQGVAETPTSRGETVLIVEDDFSILKLAQRILENLGYTVLAASTPGRAEALAEEHAGHIHLLITDVVMPEMNGRDLAESLKAHYPTLKVLFMSGYTSNVIAHRGVLDSGVNFIQKPFSTRDLAVKVREALNRD